MTVYKKGFIVATCLSIVSIGVAAWLNYGLNEKFWCNAFLGILGSSLLTMLTSIIGYHTERRTVLENFYTETIKLLNRFNRYQTDLTLEQKIGFFLDLSDYDTTNWDCQIGKMDFFYNDNRDYIYQKIYEPILDVYRMVGSHSWNFRMHKNGTGRNDAVMEKFISEIELKFIETKKFSYDTEDGEISVPFIKNKLVEDMFTELNGKYYELMYGTRKAKKEKQNNGKNENANGRFSRKQLQGAGKTVS